MEKRNTKKYVSIYDKKKKSISIGGTLCDVGKYEREIISNKKYLEYLTVRERCVSTSHSGA